MDLEHLKNMQKKVLEDPLREQKSIIKKSLNIKNLILNNYFEFHKINQSLQKPCFKHSFREF